MLLVFTSKEVERIIGNFSNKRPKIEFLGDNKLKIKISGISISLFLQDVKPKKLSFLYKMNSIVNFFTGKFMNLDKPGIIWDKKSDLISIDLEQFVQEDKLRGFFIRQLLFDTEKMILDFDLKENEKA
jgi:hypothetical protein